MYEDDYSVQDIIDSADDYYDTVLNDGDLFYDYLINYSSVNHSRVNDDNYLDYDEI
jgi:hypothetical protein